jgi:hypothetical protein
VSAELAAGSFERNTAALPVVNGVLIDRVGSHVWYRRAGSRRVHAKTVRAALILGEANRMLSLGCDVVAVSSGRTFAELVAWSAEKGAVGR